MLHESGHDFGLQHNFIGSMAYTAHQLQDTGFTSRFGVASSVMEYAPVNLWPAGTRQGDYVQLGLGPYDYHAIRFGYENIPGATSPEAEVPELNRLAGSWSNPLSALRVRRGRLVRERPRGRSARPTGRPDEPSARVGADADDDAAWHHERGRPPLSARWANRTMRPVGLLSNPLRLYTEYAVMPAHIIGGEYMSRANAGDPRSRPPLQRRVARRTNIRPGRRCEIVPVLRCGLALQPERAEPLDLSRSGPLNVSAKWVYNPPPRHDVADRRDRRPNAGTGHERVVRAADPHSASTICRRSTRPGRR